MNNLCNGLLKRVVFTMTMGVLVAGLSACAKPAEKMLAEEPSTEVNTSVAPVVTVSDIISQAQARHDQALQLSHGWTRTQPLIDEAFAALDAGDKDTARALAERALTQASASVAQAQSEVTAWKERVVK